MIQLQDDHINLVSIHFFPYNCSPLSPKIIFNQLFYFLYLQCYHFKQLKLLPITLQESCFCSHFSMERIDTESLEGCFKVTQSVNSRARLKTTSFDIDSHSFTVITVMHHLKAVLNFSFRIAGVCQSQCTAPHKSKLQATVYNLKFSDSYWQLEVDHGEYEIHTLQIRAPPACPGSRHHPLDCH